MSSDAVEKIMIFSRWLGFAQPPFRAEKLTIARTGDRYSRHWLPAGQTDVVPASTVHQLIEALAYPIVPELRLALFDIPEATMQAHYGSIWTDDSPGHLIQIQFAGGRKTTIRTEAQHAFMLPLQVSIGPGNALVNTFDPRLSQAITALMPAGYLEMGRLAGRHWMLEHDMSDRGKQEDVADVPHIVDAQAPEADAGDFAAGFEEILRILSNVESPAEKEDAERAGRLSERLLRRISAEETRDLLARGANPSIADENGQTALMSAAWPPFDRERFRLLAQAGADLEARRFDGYTGLHLACASGEANAAAEWVRAGADVHSRGPEGSTPLMLAACWLDIVPMLLAADADVNAADQDGHTALIYGIMHQSWIQAERNLAAMRALVDAGAQVNRRDAKGISSLGHARQVLARVLLEEGVTQAFNPQADLRSLRQAMDWDARRMAEAVVAMLTSAGAAE